VEEAVNELAREILFQAAKRFNFENEETAALLAAETKPTTAVWHNSCTTEGLLDPAFSVRM